MKTKTYGRNSLGQFVGSFLTRLNNLPNSSRKARKNTGWLIAILFLVGFSSIGFTAFNLYKQQDTKIDIVHAAEVGKPDPIIYAIQEAKKAGLNPVTLLRIIDCESGFDPNAVGVNPKDKSVDLGFVQINHKWHKEVPIADKLNPYKSVDFIIKTRLQDKNYHQWSCSKILNLPK